MAPRIYLIFVLIGVLSAQGIDIVEYPDIENTDSSIYYEVTTKPEVIDRIYKNVFSVEDSIESLVTDNPSLHILMKKAKKRSTLLEMRLLQWSDHMKSLAMIEKQFKQYVDHKANLEMDTLINYAEWCVSIDSGAPKGILEKIHNMVVPMFSGEGLIELLQKFLLKVFQ